MAQSPIGRFDTGLYGLSGPNQGIDDARARKAFLANKTRLTPDEEAEYSRLDSYTSGVPLSGSGSATSAIFNGQKGLLDSANAFAEKQMGLSNKYRGIEGAWQSQIDEQANRRIVTDGGQKIDLQKTADAGADQRIKTDGDVKISLQNNQGAVDEAAKQNDARRALVNFRSSGTGGG